MRAGLTAVVHANVVVSLAAMGVAMTSFFVLDIRPNAFLLGFAFAAAFCGYTLNRLWDVAEDRHNLPDRRAFIASNRRRLLVIAVAIYGIGGLGLVVVDHRLVVALAVPPLAAWLYSPGRLKRVLFVKNAFVGGLWASIPVGIGLLDGRPFDPAVIALGFVIAVAVTIAAVVFDIKDVTGDAASGISTVPIRIGSKRTRLLALVGLIPLTTLLVIASITLSSRFLLLFVYVAYLGAYIPFATQDRGVLFYGFIIDGEHVVIGLCASALWLLT